VDVAWEASGEVVVVAWSPWNAGTNIRYFSWTKGTALAGGTVQTGPDFLNDIYLVRTFPIHNSEKIILMTRNATSTLRYSLWTGDKFASDPAILLGDSLQNAVDMPFDIAGGP